MKPDPTKRIPNPPISDDTMQRIEAKAGADQSVRTHRTEGPDVDDAIHIDDPRRGIFTLCGEKKEGRNVAAFDRFPRPDTFSGCWTCLIEAEKRDA